MSDSIGRVQLDLETNYTPFQQQLNGISGKATGMVSTAFKKLGGVVAGAFAVTKLVQFGKASIDLASDLAEVQNVVDVVFGKSASQINNFAKSALTSYGLSELSAKRYTSTMGAMLKSMGLSQESVLGMSQSITALAGDMASFYNLSSDDAFNKIRSGISGETEPLKQLGINMSVANMEAFALSQGITKSYQKMTQSEQALLRYKYLISTTADAQGDFARTSDSWANQTRILGEQFNSLKATLGSAFIAVLTPVVKWLNVLISKLQVAASYFKALVESLTGTKAESSGTAAGIGAIAEETEGVAASATKASKALAGFDKLNVLSSSGGDSPDDSSGGLFDIDIPSASGIAIPEPDTSGVESVITAVKNKFDSLRQYLVKSFKPSVESWGKAFTNLKTPVKQAFGEVSRHTQNLWNNTLAPFGDYVSQTWVPDMANTFSETFAPIFSDVMKFALGQFTADFEFACNQVDRCVTDILTPTMETMKTVCTDTWTSVSDEWAKNGDNLLNLFGGFRDSIKGIWDNLYDTVLKPVWDSITQAIDELWDKHLKGLWDSIVRFTSKLGECVMTIWNNFLAPIVNWWIETVGPKMKNRFQFIIENVKTVIGVISDVCKGIFNALGGLLDFITGVFSKDWNKAWGGIKDFFKGIWDAIWTIIKYTVNLIIDGLNGLWSGIYNVVKGIINGLGGIAGAIGDLLGKDWKFSMPSKPPLIPKLAEGGIIDQPTLAMVGEAGKEAVVPLENTAFADSIANAILRVLAPLFANNKNNIGKSDEATVIVLKVGEYELGRITVGAINKYHNAVGKIELEV